MPLLNFTFGNGLTESLQKMSLSGRKKLMSLYDRQDESGMKKTVLGIVVTNCLGGRDGRTTLVYYAISRYKYDYKVYIVLWCVSYHYRAKVEKKKELPPFWIHSLYPLNKSSPTKELTIPIFHFWEPSTSKNTRFSEISRSCGYDSSLVNLYPYVLSVLLLIFAEASYSQCGAETLIPNCWVSPLCSTKEYNFSTTQVQPLLPSQRTCRPQLSNLSDRNKRHTTWWRSLLVLRYRNLYDIASSCQMLRTSTGMG